MIIVKLQVSTTNKMSNVQQQSVDGKLGPKKKSPNGQQQQRQECCKDFITYGGFYHSSYFYATIYIDYSSVISTS
jgi:hypothetical protein